MNVPKIEDYIGLQLGKEALKKAVGDKPEFDLMFNALLDQMKNDINTSVEEGESARNTAAIPTLAGNGLNSLEAQQGNVTNTVNLENIPVNSTRDLSYFLELYNDYESKNHNTIRTLNTGVGISKIAGINNLDTVQATDEMTKIYKTVEKYAEKSGVDKDLILAIIKTESNFNPTAQSGAGAKGLMQLMDFNSKAAGLTNPFDIEQNIQAGSKLLKGYLDMYDGDVQMALMAYNGGPGTMERRGVESATDIYKMPKETQNYIPKVLGYYKNGIL